MTCYRLLWTNVDYAFFAFVKYDEQSFRNDVTGWEDRGVTRNNAKKLHRGWEGVTLNIVASPIPFFILIIYISFLHIYNS